MPAPGQRGSALITVLLVVAVLAVLAAGALSLSLASARSARHWDGRLAALYAAESGVNDALRLLALGQRPTSITSDPALMGDPGPSYQVTITYDGNRATVVSRGRSPDGASVRQVQAVILLGGAGCLFDDSYDGTADGLIACDNPANAPPCTAQAVDATVADQCPGTCPEGDLEVPKDGTRTLEAGTYASESIRVKEGGRLVVNGPATIYVDRYLQLDTEASLVIRGGAVTFRIRGEGGGDALRVGKEGAVTVEAGARAAFTVQGDAVFGNESRLETAGPTELFVYGDLKVGEDAQLGTDLTMLVVYLDTGAGTGDVKIEASAAVQGGIYAPTREVELKHDATLTGAVVGREIKLKQNAAVSYDPDAGAAVLGGGCGPGVSPGSWTPL